MLDKTPLEMALEREGQIEYCDECEYVRVVDNTVFCGLSGKLLHPMMFLRGQGFGPARRCTKRKEAREMGLTAADLQRMGPEAQRQVMEKLGIVGKTKAPKYHNQPDSRGNLRFDSKKEARRYDELMLTRETLGLWPGVSYLFREAVKMVSPAQGREGEEGGYGGMVRVRGSLTHA